MCGSAFKREMLPQSSPWGLTSTGALRATVFVLAKGHGLRVGLNLS